MNKRASLKSAYEQQELVINCIGDLGSDDLRSAGKRVRRDHFMGNMVGIAWMASLIFMVDSTQLPLLQSVYIGFSILLILLAAIHDAANDGCHKKIHETNLKNSDAIDPEEYKCIKKVLYKYPELRDARIRMGYGFIMKIEADYIIDYDHARGKYLPEIRKSVDLSN